MRKKKLKTSMTKSLFFGQTPRKKSGEGNILWDYVSFVLDAFSFELHLFMYFCRFG
jgi:hypothetical protein